MDQLLISILNLLMLSGCQTLSVLDYTNQTTDTIGTSSISAMTDPPAFTEASFNGNPTYVSCLDRFSFFLKEDHYDLVMDQGTLGTCFRWCVRLGMSFAAIHNRLCSCGFHVTLMYHIDEDHYCSSLCDDMPGFTCGGPTSFSLYNTTHLLPPAQNEGVDSETDVSFLIGRQEAILLYNSSNLNNPRLLFESHYRYESFTAADYHYSKNLLFVATQSALYKTTLFRKNISELHDSIVLEIEGCQSFAVDWVQDKIIWVSCNSDDKRTTSCTLKFIDFEGNITSTISADLNTTYIREVAVDPYHGMVFWINSDYVIESCGTSGANMRTNISKPGVRAKELALDIPSKRLFYFALLETASAVYSVDYNGGDLKTHLEVPRMEHVYGLGITRGYVYWVDFGLLYKAPLYRGPSAQMMALKLPTDYYPTNIVSYLKVVDPDLQRAPKTGPCSCDNNSCLGEKLMETKTLLLPYIIIGVVGLVVAGLVALS